MVGWYHDFDNVIDSHEVLILVPCLSASLRMDLVADVTDPHDLNFTTLIDDLQSVTLHTKDDTHSLVLVADQVMHTILMLDRCGVDLSHL